MIRYDDIKGDFEFNARVTQHMHDRMHFTQQCPKPISNEQVITAQSGHVGSQHNLRHITRNVVFESKTMQMLTISQRKVDGTANVVLAVHCK